MLRSVRYTGRGAKHIAYAPGLWRRGTVRTVGDDVADRLLEREDFETATCMTVKDDGEVCGRQRPCRYHD